MCYTMSNRFRSILIPTDFSPAAWKAMQIGLELGYKYKSGITVLHVFPVSKNSEQPLFEQLENVRNNMEKLSNELTEESGQEITNVVVSGNVNEALTEFITKNQYDLVIMGINGNGQDNNPGTHTVNVITQSSVPVLVVPNSYSMND